MKRYVFLLSAVLFLSGTLRSMTRDTLQSDSIENISDIATSGDISERASEIIEDHAEQPILGETALLGKKAAQLAANKNADLEETQALATQLMRKRKEKLKSKNDLQARLDLLTQRRDRLINLIDKFNADLEVTEDDEKHYSAVLAKLKEEFTSLTHEERIFPPDDNNNDDNDNENMFEELPVSEIKRRSEKEIGTILVPGIHKKQQILDDIRSYLHGLRIQIGQLNGKLNQSESESNDVQERCKKAVASLDAVEKALQALHETHKNAVVPEAITAINERRAEEARRNPRPESFWKKFWRLIGY